MRTITKLMLALGVVGSLSLTSCKDYDEDNYNEVSLTVNDQLKQNAAAMAEMQQKISALATQLQAIKSCECTDYVKSIAKGAGETLLVTYKDGRVETIELPKMQLDGDGNYFTDSNGNKVYIPNVKQENGKTYIVIGDKEYELGAGSTTVVTGPSVSIDGTKITITDGDKSWTFDSATGSGTGCTCSIKLNWDAEKGTYTISDGTNPGIEIPTGTYNFDALLTDNGDGTVTVKIGENETIIKKVASEVSVKKSADGKNNVLVIQKYSENGQPDGDPQEIVLANEYDDTELQQLIIALYGEGGTSLNPTETSIVGRFNKVESTLTTVEGDVATNKRDIATAKSDLKEIEKALYGEGGTYDEPVEGSIVARINALELRVENLEESLAKLVTGIVVQDVVNPAFGSYTSLFTNVQTNMLVAYYGKAANSITFPTIDPQDDYKFNAGDLVMDGTEAAAGALYLTINPNTVDFTGLKLDLVNTKDEACGITLKGARKTTDADDALKFGLTRAAGDNGLYVVPAVVSEDAVNDPKLHINIDYAAYKNLISEAIKVRNLSDAKPVMKDLLSVAIETSQALALERQGVKCSWEDAYGEHSVYSKYDIAAVAQQPLGFYTVDEVFKDGGLYWRGYDKAKNMLTKVAKRFGKSVVNTLNSQLNLDKIQTDLDNIVIDRIDEVKVADDAMKMTFTLDTTLVIRFKVEAGVDFSDALEELRIPDQFEYDEVTGEVKAVHWQTVQALKDADLIKVTTKLEEGKPGDPDATEFDIRFVKTFTVDMTDKIQNIIDGINSGFSDTNKLLDALEQLMDDTNDMLKHIRELEDKLEAGNYMNRVYKYLDKVANAVGKYTPMLFKPALFVNSADGFGIVGGYGSPAVVSSTTVNLIPTTYSGELLSPVFKKYIRVNGGAGQIVNGKSIQVNLKKGLNKIEYYALDYLCNQYPQPGNESAGEYYIYVK